MAFSSREKFGIFEKRFLFVKFVLQFDKELMLKLKTKILFFLMFVNLSLFSQSLTNLEVLNSLVDSSITRVSKSVRDQSLTYNFLNKTVREYASLNTHAENSLVKAGVKVDFNNQENEITYSIMRASVQYPEIFKDGFWGEYLIERKFILSGEYQIKSSSKVLTADAFYYSMTDTISYSNVNLAENNSIPFTKSKLPSEPFFPSILEPVIAITAVAVTVILFFSVRSK